jgi:NADH-quinone oxidoreductase subunit J
VGRCDAAERDAGSAEAARGGEAGVPGDGTGGRLGPGALRRRVHAHRGVGASSRSGRDVRVEPSSGSVGRGRPGVCAGPVVGGCRVGVLGGSGIGRGRPGVCARRVVGGCRVGVLGGSSIGRGRPGVCAGPVVGGCRVGVLGPSCDAGGFSGFSRTGIPGESGLGGRACVATSALGPEVGACDIVGRGTSRHILHRAGAVSGSCRDGGLGRCCAGAIGGSSRDGGLGRSPRRRDAVDVRGTFRVSCLLLGLGDSRAGSASTAGQDRRGRVMSAELGFGLLALLLVGLPALRVVTSPDLVRAILWLAAALLGTAVLYAFLHAPFLAGVQVLTYVGGVVTLMVFGVMVTRKHDGSNVALGNTGRLRGAIAALAFFVVVATAILRTDLSSLLPVETPSTQDLALSLLDRYLLAFEVASVLLLAAIVSAVVLARRKDPAPESPTATEVAALREGSAP